MQNLHGDSYINAKAGKKIYFGHNNDETIILTQAEGFVPVQNDTMNLGSGAKRWLNFYCKNGFFGNLNTDSVIISDMGLGADYAGFSHKNNANANDCALLQHKDGATSINSSSGEPINFTIGQAPIMRLESTEVVFNVSLTTSELSVTGITGNCLTSPNANTSFEFGRAKIGYVGHNDVASFAHRNFFTTTNFGYSQKSNGDSVVNSGGTEVILRVHNVSKLTVSSSLITFLVATSGPSDRRFKKNITTPSPSKNWNDFKLIEIKQYNKVYPNINSDKIKAGCNCPRTGSN
jgi:hypothetical protein